VTAQQRLTGNNHERRVRERTCSVSRMRNLVIRPAIPYGGLHLEYMGKDPRHGIALSNMSYSQPWAREGKGCCYGWLLRGEMEGRKEAKVNMEPQ
jgi:hypothetical protein